MLRSVIYITISKNTPTTVHGTSVIRKSHLSYYVTIFLAVQDSSIGDLVTD